jgi:arginine repressor
MNQDNLTETIDKSIEELGFARIPRAAVTGIFSSGEPVSFETNEKLKKFAEEQGLKIREEDDFVIFERKEAE